MASGSGLGSFLILLLPLLLLGFLVLSNRRRVRDQQQVQASLTVGQDIMTSSGIFGRITSLEDSAATVEIAPGVHVRVDRRAITRPPAGSTAGPAQPQPPAAGDE